MSTAATFTAKDVAKLRNKLLVAGVLIAVGAGLIFWEFRQTTAAKAALSAAETSAQGAERKLRAVYDEEVELKAKSALYRQLEARRIVGPEQRLVWVEAITAVQDRRKLFRVDYEISPQQALGTPVGGYQFHSSTMQFRLPLLHENDLSGFIGDLRREAPAVVHVDQCRIERAAATGDTSLAPGLSAQCALQWITLQDTRKEVRK